MPISTGHLGHVTVGKHKTKLAPLFLKRPAANELISWMKLIENSSKSICNSAKFIKSSWPCVGGFNQSGAQWSPWKLQWSFRKAKGGRRKADVSILWPVPLSTTWSPWHPYPICQLIRWIDPFTWHYNPAGIISVFFFFFYISNHYSPLFLFFVRFVWSRLINIWFNWFKLKKTFRKNPVRSRRFSNGMPTISIFFLWRNSWWSQTID